MADQGNVFSFDAAKAQYEVLFLQEDKTLPAVKALCGGFKNSGIRGLVWKVLLGLLPSGDESNWKEIISAKRAAYVELSARHIIKQADLVAHDGDPLDDNPLMQNEDSVWTKYFAQQEIEKEIQKDLERIFPEFEFFQQPAIQEVMLRVLLVWSKLNPDVSYRQGMHELLGPLLMTLVNSSFKADEAQLSHPIAVLCSADDVEADSYLLFEIMMHKMKDMFAVVGSVKSLPGQPPIDYRYHAPHSCKFKIPFSIPSLTRPAPHTVDPPPLTTADCSPCCACRAESTTLFCVQKILNSTRIFKIALLNRSCESRSALREIENCDVCLRFLLKWIRLMFGRNFHLDDVVILWDAIFAQVFTTGSWMEMIELLSVSMIMYIRGDLLQKQGHQALQRLMKCVCEMPSSHHYTTPALILAVSDSRQLSP
jgi:TBC1 domain family protein 5